MSAVAPKMPQLSCFQSIFFIKKTKCQVFSAVATYPDSIQSPTNLICNCYKKFIEVI